MELAESERELRTQYEMETGKEHREWNEGKVLSADYVKWLEAKLSERTSEAHGEVSPLEARVSTTGDWNSVKEANTPEEGQEVEVNIAGEVIEARYKGIFSKGYNEPFAHTWLIRDEEIQNNTILWRPK